MLANSLKGTYSLAMSTVTFIKRIFYTEEYWKITSSYNPRAGQIYMKNIKDYFEEAKTCVEDAGKNLYQIHQNSTLRFSNTIPQHETILNKILTINKETVLIFIIIDSR